MNKDKIIVSLCGGTGSWEQPYKNADYDTINITLPQYDVTKYHFDELDEKYLYFLDKNTNERLNILIENIYGILAAPPCREFSLAKTTGNKRDLIKGMETVIACLNIIWECRYKYKLEFWALENPRCILRQFLGKPAFTYYHWEFGDIGLKPTDIWGYFNIPKITHSVKPKNMTIQYPCGSWNIKGWGSMSSEVKAITPPGFSQAFYEANK